MLNFKDKNNILTQKKFVCTTIICDKHETKDTIFYNFYAKCKMCPKKIKLTYF